jgi:hypothetical protein
MSIARREMEAKANGKQYSDYDHEGDENDESHDISNSTHSV